MGSGSPSVLLAWGPTGAAVLAADIGSLIQNPAVLLGAAAVVVVAVLIVLIMVLRGGSRKAELASEMDDERGAWDSAPRGVPSQADRGRDSRDQMLPWEQGGARMDGGRQAVGGRRGPTGRDAQAGWGQAEQEAPQWEARGQSSSRGGQWVGTDEWVPPEAAMGRGNADQRGQGQMGARGNDGWAWAADQAASGGQNANQWGQGAAAPMARDDQWGQGPANGRPMGRGDDQWGQGAAPMGRGDDQWGQRPGASHPMGREEDQWGQGAGMRGRGQDQWGSPSGPNGYHTGQAEEQGYDMRSGPRRGAEPAAQPEGQWGQGGWGQANAGWNSGEPAGQWGQAAPPVQPPQSARPAQPGVSRPNSQGNLAGMGSQPLSSPDARGEWGERGFNGPGMGSSPQGGGWGEREAPAWQAEPRQEQPAWDAPGWQSAEPTGPRSGPRSQPPAPPQWDQPGRGAAEPAWENAADQWGQAAPPARPSPSQPIEPAGARGMSQPAAAGGEWGNRDFERPTTRPSSQPNSWDQRDAPAWQSPAPQMAASGGPVDAPTARPAPDARRLGNVSPESTAYTTPAPETSEGAADKTVVIRKDAGAGRIPSVVVRQGKEPGRSYDMRKDHITIGRSRESDIFLEDLAVSRLHATIYRDEMGGYLLRDENSANGTTVNGQRITETALQEGDEIQLGQTILAFVRR